MPADPESVAALVPAELCPLPGHQVFTNQYVIDDDMQSSGFGAYPVTYLGVDLAPLAATGTEGSRTGGGPTTSAPAVGLASSVRR